MTLLALAEITRKCAERAPVHCKFRLIANAKQLTSCLYVIFARRCRDFDVVSRYVTLQMTSEQGGGI